MVSHVEKVLKKPFVRNVLIMVTGTASAQAVHLLLSPFITRLYGPEAFGLMGLFVAIIGVFTPIAALTYSNAIVLPESDEDAKKLVKLSINISLFFGVLMGLVLLFLHSSIVKVLKIEEIGPYLYLLPVVILFAALSQTAEQWLIRTKQFSVNAKVAFVQSILYQGGKVGIGLFFPLASVLIVLSAAAEGLKALLLIGFSRKSNYQSPLHTSKSSYTVWGIARRYNDFPKYRAPQSFINAVSQSLPVILLASFFGPASAGFYAIGRTVLSMPVQLIGKSVGDVFYPRIAEADKRGENISALINKATSSLALLGILPFGAVIVLGPWLFAFVFGEEWITAGEYARWIAFWAFSSFIARPSIVSLPVLSAQKFHLVYTIIMLLVWSASLAIGFYVFSSDDLAVALWGITGGLLNFILILITLLISSRHDEGRKQENP